MNEEHVNEIETVEVWQCSTEQEKSIPGETVTTVTDNDFINDDNVDAFKLLNLKSKINDINSVIESVNNKQNELFKDLGDFDFIDKNIENVSEEEINSMTDEDIDKLLTDEDGIVTEFAVSFKTVKELNQFKREFLVMRKQTLDSFKKFDEELAKLNAEIAESQEEFDKLVNTFGNVSNLIRHNLEEKLANAANNSQKELFIKLIDSFDNGINLNNLKAYCKSYKGANILWDHKDDKKATYIYRRYLKVIKNLNIKTDLTKFNFLEKRFLSEEYQERDNIFVFAVIHYISSWHNKAYTKADGLFLTQFTINLKNLFYNKFDSEDDKNTFIENIIDVIKIIG